MTTKIFNASKFVLMQIGEADEKKLLSENITVELDKAWIAKLRNTVERTITAFDKFDYAYALQITEDTFWNFCDHYLELVKIRCYQEADTEEGAFRSVLSISDVKMLFASICTFSSLYYGRNMVLELCRRKENCNLYILRHGLIPLELENVLKPASEKALDAAIEVLSKIRGEKTQNQKSLKWPVSSLEIKGNKDDIDALQIGFTRYSEGW